MDVYEEEVRGRPPPPPPEDEAPIVANKEISTCERVEPHDLERTWGVAQRDLPQYGQPVTVDELGDCLEIGRNDEVALVRRVYPLCDRRFDAHGIYAVPLDQVRRCESTIVRLRLGGAEDANWVVSRGNPDDHYVVAWKKLSPQALARAKARWPKEYERMSARWE